MKVLIIEDQDLKHDEILEVIRPELKANSLELFRASTMRDATREIYQREFDLIIIDLMLPSRPDEEAMDISDEILETLSESDKNSTTQAIALTSFQELMAYNVRSFNEANIPVVQYQSNSGAWKNTLARELQSISNASLFQFAIVCALEKERKAFRFTDADIGEKRIIRGLDCQEISIGDHRGILVKPPRMGMTDTAIVATRIIDEFRPEIICMSGICAGIPDKSKIGDVIIAENCFDYQVGKWGKHGFEFEIYPIPLTESIRAELEQSTEEEDLQTYLRNNLGFPELMERKVRLALNATGSAVVADKTRRSEIVQQHRKLASVEMEIYSLYRAATISPYEPKFFAVKGVVDDAGQSKGDTYHEYGAVTSARLTTKALERLLEKM